MACRFVVSPILLLALPLAAAQADYRPTPLSKALAAHELVVVGEVTERANGEVKVKSIAVVKGEAPDSLLTLPDVWRLESFCPGPVPLERGKTYFLMLQRKPGGGFALSPNKYADGVVGVSSRDAPLVRAAVILHALSQQNRIETRVATLAQAWAKESDETKLRLVEAFAQNPPDVATVPFLVEALSTEDKHFSLIGMSAHAMQKHKYKETVPALLRTVKSKGPGCLDAAKTLGLMKVREAYEPIMALIDDPAIGNRPYFIEALVYLEDKRAIPFFLKTLYRNLHGSDQSGEKIKSWSIQENEFAALGLGRLRAPQAIDPLLVLLAKAGHKDLRVRAVQALGDIGPPAHRASAMILELLRTEQIPSHVADEALRKIGVRPN
ncbi:MAG: hypothetical protein L0215_13000 [Gemmataceae bacterium]|nr:hypothetical protein [Gemmataceae bacterium]